MDVETGTDENVAPPRLGGGQVVMEAASTKTPGKKRELPIESSHIDQEHDEGHGGEETATPGGEATTQKRQKVVAPPHDGDEEDKDLWNLIPLGAPSNGGPVSLEGDGQAVTFGRGGGSQGGVRKIALIGAGNEISRRQAELQIDGHRLLVKAGGSADNAVVVGRVVRPTDPSPTQVFPNELLILDGFKFLVNSASTTAYRKYAYHVQGPTTTMEVTVEDAEGGRPQDSVSKAASSVSVGTQVEGPTVVSVGIQSDLMAEEESNKATSVSIGIQVESNVEDQQESATVTVGAEVQPNIPPLPCAAPTQLLPPALHASPYPSFRPPPLRPIAPPTHTRPLPLPELTNVSLQQSLEASSHLVASSIIMCGDRVHCSFTDGSAIKCQASPSLHVQTSCSRPDCPGGLCPHFLALVMALKGGDTAKLVILPAEDAAFICGQSSLACLSTSHGGNAADPVTRARNLVSRAGLELVVHQAYVTASSIVAMVSQVVAPANNAPRTTLGTRLITIAVRSTGVIDVSSQPTVHKKSTLPVEAEAMGLPALFSLPALFTVIGNLYQERQDLSRILRGHSKIHQDLISRSPEELKEILVCALFRCAKLHVLLGNAIGVVSNQGSAQAYSSCLVSRSSWPSVMELATTLTKFFKLPDKTEVGSTVLHCGSHLIFRVESSSTKTEHLVKIAMNATEPHKYILDASRVFCDCKGQAESFLLCAHAALAIQKWGQELITPTSPQQSSPTSTSPTPLELFDTDRLLPQLNGLSHEKLVEVLLLFAFETRYGKQAEKAVKAALSLAPGRGPLWEFSLRDVTEPLPLTSLEGCQALIRARIKEWTDAYHAAKKRSDEKYEKAVVAYDNRFDDCECECDCRNYRRYRSYYDSECDCDKEDYCTCGAAEMSEPEDTKFDPTEYEDETGALELVEELPALVSGLAKSGSQDIANRLALQFIVALTSAVPTSWTNDAPWLAEIEGIKETIKSLVTYLMNQASELNDLPFEPMMPKLRASPHKNLLLFTFDLLLTSLGPKTYLVEAIKEWSQVTSADDLNDQLLALMGKAGLGHHVLDTALSWLTKATDADVLKPLNVCLTAIRDMRDDGEGAKEKAVTKLLDTLTANNRSARTCVMIIDTLTKAAIPLSQAQQLRLGKIIAGHVKTGIDPDSFLTALRLVIVVLKVSDTLEETTKFFPPLSQPMQLKTFVDLVLRLGPSLWQSQALSTAFLDMLSPVQLVRNNVPHQPQYTYGPPIRRLSFYDLSGRSVMESLSSALPLSGPTLKNDNARRSLLKLMTRVMLCRGELSDKGLVTAFSTAAAFDTQVGGVPVEVSYINVVAEEVRTVLLADPNMLNALQREQLCRTLAKYPHPACKAVLEKELVKWLQSTSGDRGARGRAVHTIISMWQGGGMPENGNGCFLTFFVLAFFNSTGYDQPLPPHMVTLPRYGPMNDAAFGTQLGNQARQYAEFALGLMASRLEDVALPVMNKLQAMGRLQDLANLKNALALAVRGVLSKISSTTFIPCPTRHNSWQTTHVSGGCRPTAINAIYSIVKLDYLAVALNIAPLSRVFFESVSQRFCHLRFFRATLSGPHQLASQPFPALATVGRRIMAITGPIPISAPMPPGPPPPLPVPPPINRPLTVSMPAVTTAAATVGVRPPTPTLATQTTAAASSSASGTTTASSSSTAPAPTPTNGGDDEDFEVMEVAAPPKPPPTVIDLCESQET